MALTHALGERYLWVDALCIVQDGEDKMLQLDAMAAIFARACLTIVNAEGEHADTGFRGLPDISGERHLEQQVASLQPYLQLVKPGSKQVWDALLLQPWSTRAWTFQEEICSRRILYFAHDSVRWACRAARWSEESESPDCLRTYAHAEQRQFSLETPKISASRLPQLAEYEALINGFNCRALKYPEDVLYAFAGVCMRLGTKFPGGMISGLPELFFDVCLLWQPQRGSDSVRRRESKMKSVECTLPSWSWVGWITEVTWPYTWNRTLDITDPVAMMVENMRPFYGIELHYRNEQGLKKPIKIVWASFGQSAIDEKIPPGWSRHELSDTGDYEAMSTCYFTHESDPAVGFWFPIPSCGEPQLPRIVKELEFKTTAGKFRLGDSRRSMTRIHALDDTVAGILWQHDEKDEDYVRATSGLLLKDRPTIELVAIIGCVVPNDDGNIWEASDLSLKEIGEFDEEPIRVREFYNVLWIERNINRTYRKGTGEIDRQVWEKHALEWVDIILC